MSTARVFDYDEVTTQVPIVHGPTQLDTAKERTAEVASLIGSHAKTAAVVAGKTWWQVARTSPQGFYQTASKTLAWVKDERGAERIESHYAVLTKFNADEAANAKVALKQSARCEKFEKRHRRRVARRSAVIAAPNLAFLGVNAYAHARLPAIAEGLVFLAEAGLASTVFGVVGNNQAVEIVRQMTRRNRISDETLRKALRDLGILTLRRDLEREKPDTSIGMLEVDKQRGTITTTVELPSGVDVREVISRRRRLAANLHKSESQVIVAEGSSAHELIITIYKHDVSQRIVETWPLANINSVNMFDAIPLGVDPSGAVITYTFDESHLFVAGMSRWGKSVTMQTLAATLALDPRVEIWVWNGTDAATFGFLEPIARVYVNGNAAKDQATRDKGARIISMLNDEMDKRGKILATLGREKVDNDCAHVEGLNPIVVFMDEIAPLFADNPKVMQSAEHLANQCLKFGIYLVAATQTFDKRAVPWSFVSLFQKKIGHRLAKPGDNQAIFGDDYAERGINACKIRVKGEAILDGEAETHQTLRVYFADDASRNAAVARGLKARGGVVERLEVATTPPQPKRRNSSTCPDLLRDILDIAEQHDETKLQCREIVTLLPMREEYQRFTFDPENKQQRNEVAAELADLLRTIFGRKTRTADGKEFVRDVSKPKFGPTAPGVYVAEVAEYLQSINS